MIYGGERPKPIPPSIINIAQSRTFKGPNPYTYSIVAKQPGNDYKIRLRDMERVRTERLKIQNEDNFKSLIRHGQHKELMDVTDRKCLYNRIKGMVEREMKANEHLFVDEPPKPELKIDEKPEVPEVSEKDLMEKAKELKQQRDDEERKIVEEKRLQLFIDNSEELRSAAMAKRKKDISDINHKIIQEKERINKEQTFKKREQNKLEHLEMIKKQALEKEEEKRKIIEKKQQFRKELYEQVQEKEKIRIQEKELKVIECNEFKKLNEKLNEEKELEKLERIKKQTQRIEEIKKFTEERANLFSNMNKVKEMFDETFAITMKNYLKDDTANEIEAKIQLRHENEMFMKHHEMVKEERRKQNEETSKMIQKQINEIDELKRSIEDKTAEARRKRTEKGNNDLKEQLKLREKLFEEQKEMKRKTYEQSAKEYEEYLETEKQLWEKKKQLKWQIRKDLSDQINARKNIIEKQRNIDFENHKKCMMEITEQEKLLKKLLNEL